LLEPRLFTFLNSIITGEWMVKANGHAGVLEANRGQGESVKRGLDDWSPPNVTEKRACRRTRDVLADLDYTGESKELVARKEDGWQPCCVVDCC